MTTRSTTLLLLLVCSLAGPGSAGCGAAGAEEAAVLEPSPADTETGGVGAAEGEARAALIGPEPRGERTRNPIVLVHGFAASTTFFGFSDAIYRALQQAHGADRVFRAQVPAFLPPWRRAEVLEEQIRQFVGDATRVNLVGHSMGGLDARYLASPDGRRFGSHIASITTVSTPHRGSGLAGWLHDRLSAGQVRTVDAVLSRIGVAIGDESQRSDVFATLDALSPSGGSQFDREVRDDPGVAYFSWAGVSEVGALDPNPRDIAACQPTLPNWLHVLADGRPTNFVRDRMTPILAPTAFLVSGGTAARPNRGEPNDGLVTVASARHGQFMGCIPADHADEVGAVNPQLQRSGYEPVRFYLNLAYDLSHRGF